MKLSDYLKEARENCKLTQEQASKKIGASVATIQNWEYGNSYPERSLWENVIKVYNLDKKRFNELYMGEDESNNENIQKEESQDNKDLDFFKYLLENFGESKNVSYKSKDYPSPNELRALLCMELTKDEMELFVLKEIYEFGIYGASGSSGRDLQNIPYEYVKEKGIYNIINIDNSLKDKINKIPFFRNSLLKNICKSNGNFNINQYVREAVKLSYFDISYKLIDCIKDLKKANFLLEIDLNYDLCEMANKNNYQNFRLKYQYWYGKEYFEEFEKIKKEYNYEKFIEIEEIECEDEEYLTKKQKHLEALKNYKEGYGDFFPEFKPCISKIRITLNDKGKEFANFL